MKSRFTTCVANCARLDKLPKVLASLGNDHTVVVATYCGSPQHSKVVAEICPGAEHFCALEDFGCNRLWMQAISMAKTKWVSLLFDDDLRCQGFAAEVEKLIDQIEANNAGWGAWCAKAYFWADGSLKNPMDICYGRNVGVHDSRGLLSRILTPRRFPDSPASLLLQRETALDALSWAEENLQDCQTRPGFMVGNDIALLLSHVLRFPKMVQSGAYLSEYGNHNNSETCRYFQKGSSPLMQMYDQAKAKLSKLTDFPIRKDI